MTSFEESEVAQLAAMLHEFDELVKYEMLTDGGLIRLKGRLDKGDLAEMPTPELQRRCDLLLLAVAASLADVTGGEEVVSHRLSTLHVEGHEPVPDTIEELGDV